MAKEPPNANDGWDETRETIDGFRTLQQSFYPGRYPYDYDYPVRYEGPNPESFQQMEPTLARSETLSLIQKAVDTARAGMQQSLAGSERVGEAVKLKLTIDLGHQGIEMLPDEVVHILKRDVERLVLSHNHIWHIPYKFAECTPLTYLNLRGNRFKEFPKAIYKLPQLQILDLGRNNLSRVPEEIKNMKALRVLSLMNNNIIMVPLVIGFLDNLKILKLSGNPLNDGLKSVIDGIDGSPSPLVVPIAENEKDANVTKKIKKYLKAEAASLESGGESSSEGPLDTPRPLKRNTSLRFPVVPTTSGSESASDLRSPGFPKPPIPTRSHYRVGSGQNIALQNASANLRRPGIAPVVVGNERNRSNSESVLQATQNARHKRMGIVTRKHPDLGTVDETQANRSSHHYRGFSHGSVLRDRRGNDVKNVGNSSSSPASPAETERQRGAYVRRLSSLPEHKRESHAPNSVIEGAKGVLYSLHLVHPHISLLITVIEDGTSNRSSLERVYCNAATHLEQLDKELHHFDNADATQDPKGRSSKSVSNACRACIQTYQQVGKLLLHNVPQLVSRGDQRYIRTLLLLVYGSLVEARNACGNLKIKVKSAQRARLPRATVPVIHEEQAKAPGRATTPTRERPNPARRLRSEATLRQTRTHGHFNSAPNAHSAVPLYINGRSRSNSRTNTLTTSTTSSVANTPRSGESFLIPGTPLTQDGTIVNATSSYPEPDQDVFFERIYLAFSHSVEHGLRAVPLVSLQFSRCLEVARSRYAGKEIQDLWSRLISRGRYCLDMCEALKIRLSTIKLKEPEVRNTKDFWDLCLRFVGAFTKLVDGIQEAKNLKLVPLEIPRILQPVHKSSKVAINNIKNSPWAYVLKHNSPPASVQAQWQEHGHNNGRGLTNGHYRTRGGSGSSSSPYVNSVPATPLSAALGPAAQATVPSTPATSASLDRSFQGDVFQRAESLLNMQHTMLHRR